MQSQPNPFLLTLWRSFSGLCLSILSHVRIRQWLDREVWLNVHLFIALSLGFVFALIGFTGSVSVYREELDAFLNPELVIENPQGEYRSLDDIIAAVREAHPKRYGEWTLEMPTSPDRMVTVWFDKPTETFFERYAPLMVSVNPYTAEVIASRFWGQTFTTWLLDLHTQLQLDQIGWDIVGYCGILLMLSVGSGLYLWWPGVKKIPAALWIHFNSGMVRLLFDLHRMVGLLSASALLILAFTGFQLSFPSVLEGLLGSSGMAHGETGKSIISTASPNANPTMLEAAEFVARAPFQDAELRRVTTPAGDSGIFRVNLRQKWEVNRRHPYTTVWVDRWSGQIKEVRNPKTFTTGQTFMTWMWPLHTGEALGPTGRLCWFLAGQSLFFLYVSGIIRWLHGKGWVKDRAINLMNLSAFQPTIKKRGYRLLLSIDRMMNRLAQKAQPILSRLYTIVSKWLGQGIDFYQSKMKK